MPDALTGEEEDALRADLHALRDALAAALSGSRDAVKPVDLDAPIGRLTRIDALAQQKMAEASREGMALRARQVDAALARLEAGGYGTCVGCEEPVGAARLAARPETAFCLACQTRQERR